MALPERLQVILEMVTGSYKREAREAASATGKIADNAKKAGSATGKLTDTFRKYSGEIKAFLALKAAQAVKDFIVGAVAANRDLGESQNAVNKIFKESADVIHDFGEVSAQVAGLSTREFNELAVGVGGLLVNLGFGAKEASVETIRLTARAADLASVLNTDVGEALFAIQAGLRGETEPLRRFNISLSDAEIRAKAVELGLADTTAEVDRHGKAVAALELIYEQSSDAQGDFIQTSGDLANAQRIGAAEAENAQARFGEALIAPTTAIQNMTTTVLLSFQALGLFGDQNAIVAQQSLRVAEAIEFLNGKIIDGEDPFAALANSLVHIANGGELTLGTFEALAAAAGLMPDQFDEFRQSLLDQAEAAGFDQQIIDELNEAMGGVPGAASGAAGGLDDVGDSAAGAATELERAAKAQRDAITAMLEAANPAFAAAKAVDRYQAAQTKLTEVIEDSESSERDIAQAKLDTASAALEVQAALDKFDASGVTAGADAIATALDISTDEALELLSILEVLDGTKITTVVETRFVDRRTLTGATGGFVSGRQHGGPVGGPAGPGPFRIGEQNLPEMLLLSGDRGQVFSNTDVRKLISAVGAGSGASRESNFTFINSRLADDPMEAVRTALAFDSLTGVG